MDERKNNLNGTERVLLIALIDLLFTILQWQIVEHVAYY